MAEPGRSGSQLALGSQWERGNRLLKDAGQVSRIPLHCTAQIRMCVQVSELSMKAR